MSDLRDFLNEKTVKLQQTVSDWKEAVRIGGEMLVEVDACEPKYVDAMIRFVEEMGPYIVLAPGLAIPHARPEEGVLKTWFSLLTLKKPVEFGNEYNDPVYVVFSLAGKNKDEHIEALRQVATLCSNQDHFKAIKTAKSLEEIQALLELAEE